MLQSDGRRGERVFEFLDEDEEPDGRPAHRRADSSASARRGHLRPRAIRLRLPDKIIIHDFICAHPAGAEGRHCRPHRRGQDHHGQAADALLRREQRAHPTSTARDIREFDREGDLRPRFGMVLQDTWLFEGTITENIRYGQPGRHRRGGHGRRQGRARRPLHPHAARRLPDGAQRGAPPTSSQGQKQLLTIARAILADPGS